MADDIPHLDPDPPKAGSDPTSGPGIVDFLTMGLASALCLVFGGSIGYGADALAHTGPWLTFVGLAIGVVAAVLVTVSQVRKNL